MKRGLYIHIPFCKHICNYCDFPKLVPTNNDLIDKYLNRLFDELDSYKDYMDDIISIYIGGGTPNMLSDNDLERLFKKISSYDLSPKEYSIEVNPEILTKSQIKLFKKYNVTRVSIGAESLDNEVLSYLGRHHTHDDIIKAINNLKEEGINNINLDFIYAHPMDNIKRLEREINEALSLNIPHFSFYTLILEDRTLFSHNKIKMLDDDLISDLMDLVNDKLKNYHHYEISNYSFPGYESIHNLLYWSADEYIGVGMGASGYLGGIRYDNEKYISKYLKNYRMEENKLQISDLKSEYMMLGLRKLDGISITDYKKHFKTSPLDDFNLDEILKYELIEISDDKIKLTYKGYKLANVVFEVFIWEKVLN